MDINMRYYVMGIALVRALAFVLAALVVIAIVVALRQRR
jgi:hypothetical protein